MSKHFVSQALGLCLAAITTTAANAQSASDPVVVVELYTSQGCSSCPPADDYLAELTKNPDLLPLALHVDYWDYIGWADTFAQAKFTDRQHSYARAVGDRMVYTPQMIVAGAERVEGNNPAKVNKIIAAHLGASGSVDLSVERNGNRIRIMAPADKTLGSAVSVQVVRYHPSETVNIKRGENAGRSVVYRNIVTDWQQVGEWSGAQALDMEAKVTGSGPLVVILQKAGPSEILAAARIE
jgi:hypothetical protein